MDETKLLPCPFCGNNPKLSFYQDESLWSHNIVTYSQIGCSNCGYGMNFCEDSKGDKAIENWNTRKSTWISVKDRLPHSNNRVLTFSPNHIIESGMKYRILEGQFIKSCVDVTHWMLLPESPEVE